MRKTVLIGLITILGASSAQAMPLTGQSVSATITATAPGSTLTQFTSPAVVGPGVEFTGQFDDYISQIWNISLDVGADTFTIEFNSVVPGGSVYWFPSVLTVDVTGLVGLPTVSLASYTCSPANTVPCVVRGSASSRNLTSNSTSFSVQFDTVLSGERYVFGVPEPMSLATLLGGFVSLVSLRRRKKVASQA